VTVACLGGCAGSSTLIRDPHDGQAELKLYNESGSAICTVHVFPEGTTREGSNVLAEGSELGAGTSTNVWVLPGTYQVRLTGCPYERMLVDGFAPQVILRTAGVVVLFREDDEGNRQAAIRIAHEHENTTKVPAKLAINKSPTARPVVTPARARPRPR
jgi:hypothetical protein